ncbi:ThiF family adenylyltransferase [Microbacterium elymi]|uniref:ThiF family adenylyltransferase n=1 Tax=Microbacterium elymi TaxID=2909587 RepID=A0ABY5NIF1_9MICO|nr:ThiF family adenylyltransferase [Microbacterium elymi]UUT34928.1 ThiF family adenylyltransferase [Microbacterium elymi]
MPLVPPLPALSDAERVRTARHQRLAGLGPDGQRRIGAARAAVVGAGGLGSPVILALAAAGIGELVVFDDDEVDVSNLQRQVIHRRQDVGRPKTDSAERVASDLSETRVRAVRTRLTHDNAAALLAGADLVLDGTDSFASREIVAAACERLGLPLVWGTVQEFAGLVTVFWSAPPAPHEPVRLVDLYPAGSDAPACSAVGVFGPLCLQVGSLMAAEALKLITGIGRPLIGRVALIDALAGTQREAPLRAAQGTDAASAANSAANSAAQNGTAQDGPARGGSAQSGPARGGSAQNGTAPNSAVPNANGSARPAAAIAEVDEPGDAVVIDVREEFELATGTVPGFRHLPLDALLADVDAVADQVAGSPVVIVCQVGARARVAASALRAAGAEASVLRGGIEGWTGRQEARV